QFPTTGLESIPEVGSPVDGDNEIQNGRGNTFQTGEGHVRRKPQSLQPHCVTSRIASSRESQNKMADNRG
ncbi:MAG: hypothetical protein V2I33_17405, partial [Kangiellaceae bacterium]|nr:hypothetical protein [Kangiellaceae bacterium]